MAVFIQRPFVKLRAVTNRMLALARNKFGVVFETAPLLYCNHPYLCTIFHFDANFEAF
jgi:hypothetical protein